MTDKPQERPQTKHVDRVEVGETFVDHLESASVADGCAKITFSATRWPSTQEGASAMGERVTVSRLVMPLKTAIELSNSLIKLMSRLEQSGLVKGETRTGTKTSGG